MLDTQRFKQKVNTNYTLRFKFWLPLAIPPVDNPTHSLCIVEQWVPIHTGINSDNIKLIIPLHIAWKARNRLHTFILQPIGRQVKDRHWISKFIGTKCIMYTCIWQHRHIDDLHSKLSQVLGLLGYTESLNLFIYWTRHKWTNAMGSNPLFWRG